MITANPRAYIITLQDSSLIKRLAYKQDLFMLQLQKDSVFTLDDVHQKYGIEKGLENSIAFGMAGSFIKGD